MANLRQAKTDDDIKRLGVNSLKTAYHELALDYNHLLNLDYIYCPRCGKWKSAKIFYSSNTTVDGIEHYGCKECILDECTDADPKGKIRIDNKQKTINMFRKLDWYFDEPVYDDQIQSVAEGTNERTRTSATQQFITVMRSLPNWKGLTFSNSKFADSDTDSIEGTKVTQKILKAARKRFGNSYNDEELVFLENEYQDWISRYDCSQKAQEETFQNLSIIKLMKRNAIKKGAPTKDLDYSYQQWLDTGNLKPKQNTLDTFSDAQTLGTLIQKYEETRPLPEIDPELEDVDKIGLYIDAFYRGHASKMLGIKNRFANIYERVMSKYTVTPPSYDEESDSEVLFDKIFGSRDDE